MTRSEKTKSEVQFVDWKVILLDDGIWTGSLLSVEVLRALQNSIAWGHYKSTLSKE